MSGSRLSYLRLLQAGTRPEVNIDELDTIVRADVSITHELLKCLGAAAFGFREEIRSVRHGLALLGQHQIRQFVSLVALSGMGKDKPDELVISAAVRGKFCEWIGRDMMLADRAAELFLLGSLSLLNAALDQPMSVVVADLPLADDLRLALQRRPSPLLPVLEFVKGYERADWTACAELGREHGFVEKRILTGYTEAVRWARAAVR